MGLGLWLLSGLPPARANPRHGRDLRPGAHRVRGSMAGVPVEPDRGRFSGMARGPGPSPRGNIECGVPGTGCRRSQRTAGRPAFAALASRSAASPITSAPRIWKPPREDNRRVSNGDQVSRIAALAMKRGKSVDFTGYWQRHIPLARQKKRPQLGGRAEAVLDLMPEGAPRHASDVGSQSAIAINFCVRGQPKRSGPAPDSAETV
jgi:hypothetical protein